MGRPNARAFGYSRAFGARRSRTLLTATGIPRARLPHRVRRIGSSRTVPRGESPLSALGRLYMATAKWPTARAGPSSATATRPVQALSCCTHRNTTRASGFPGPTQCAHPRTARLASPPAADWRPEIPFRRRLRSSARCKRRWNCDSMTCSPEPSTTENHPAFSRTNTISRRCCAQFILGHSPIRTPDARTAIRLSHPSPKLL